MKDCVACAGKIQAEAFLCHHCGSDQRDERFIFIEKSTPETDLSNSFSDMTAKSSPNSNSEHPELPMNTRETNSEELPVISFCTKCGAVIPRGEKECASCLTGGNQKRVFYSTPRDDGLNIGRQTQMDRRLKVSLAIAACIVVIFGALTQINSGLGGLSSGKYSADTACADLSQIYQDYFDEFNAFRYSADDGTGWTKLDTLTDKAKGRISSALSRIRDGIDWDSGAVVSGMLSDVSADMSEIVTSAKRGSFTPGRNLDGILNEINTTLYSVASSACN